MTQRFLTVWKLFPLLGPWRLTWLIVQKYLGRRIVRVRLRDVPVQLFARLNNSDLSVLYQIFGLQECSVELTCRPQLIIDGGANVGYASVYLALRYPQATILAVEPCDENCGLFKRNCAPFSNIALLQGAIWHSHCPLEILNPGDRSWSIKVQEASGRTQGTIPAFTIDDLITKAEARQLDMLKLDIEGAEKDLFSKGELTWIDSVNCLIIEAHGETTRTVICDVMQQRGFHRQIAGEKLVFQRTR